RHLSREPSPLGGVDHRGDVLVGAGRLLRDAAKARCAHGDAARLELVDHLAAAPLARSRAPAHGAAGAVAGGAETARFAAVHAGQDPRARAHGTADQHRLSERPKRGRDLRVPGSEGPRGSLTVDEQGAPKTVDLVLLALAGVVGDVVDKLETRLRQQPVKRGARQVGDDLAVGQSAVDAGAHGAEILGAEIRSEWRAGKFAVGQRYPELARALHHDAQELGADLLAEAARAAVDADHHVAHGDAEPGGRFGVEQLRHVLHLEVVITRTQGAHLVAVAGLGLVRHALGPGAGHRAVLLDALEILLEAVTLFERPARAAGEHGVHPGVGQADRAGA